MRLFCSDTPLNVFELAWLTEEQEKLFTSDFKHVVHYLRQERMGQKFEILPDEVQHVTELLDLLFALTRDVRFKAAIAQAQKMANKKGVITLRSFLEEAENRGLERGLEQGLEQGREQGREQGLEQGQRNIWDILIAGGMKPQELQDRLIAGGMPPQKVANFAGMSV